MGVTERRQREKSALRGEILAAARELFAREGYESVSMRKIAEKIEYSPTTIYLYFKDKEELIEQLCEETFLLLSKKLEKVVSTDGDPVLSLKVGMRAYVDFGRKHPDHYRVSFMMPDESSKCVKSAESGPGWQAFHQMVNAVGRCIQAGRFRETDAMAISQSLWMVIHGVTSLLIVHKDCFPWVEKERLIDFTIDNAVRGLLK